MFTELSLKMNRLLTIFLFLLSVQVAEASSILKTARHHKHNKKRITFSSKANPEYSILRLGSINENPDDYKLRLDSIAKDIPLDYNLIVQGYINLYLRHRNEMAQVLGLTKYYFPIYEKAFRDAGIPDEIKYLSIVESKLNPLAVSRVGATGPWQFMFKTAKNYGLSIDKYVDQRRDPIQASYAAAAYLKDAYEEFGDWLLAIASYNCGKKNVERAIEKAGGSTDFWKIRNYLPMETRGYVPAFIAINYVFNYYNVHNIIPKECNCSIKTDTVLVDKYLTLKDISKGIDIDLAILANMNPQLKRKAVNGSIENPARLIIPEEMGHKFKELYGNIVSPNQDSLKVANVIPSNEARKNTVNLPLYHKVKKGESLVDIADNYGLDVQDLKKLNHIKNFKLPVGRKIKLYGNIPKSDKKHAKKKRNYITWNLNIFNALSV
jgi:membrane-bound lytic murein transglycosylase D